MSIEVHSSAPSPPAVARRGHGGSRKRSHVPIASRNMRLHTECHSGARNVHKDTDNFVTADHKHPY
jgi:hypothetical protein